MEKKTIKTFEETFNKERTLLDRNILFIIPKDQSNDVKFLFESYSNYIKQSLSDLEIDDELAKILENLEDKNSYNLTLTNLKEEYILEKLSEFVSNSFFHSGNEYTNKIYDFIREKSQVEGFDIEERFRKPVTSFLSIYVDRCLYFDDNNKFYLGIHTEAHYNLLKNTLEAFIDWLIANQAFNFTKKIKETLSASIHDFDGNEIEYILNEFSENTYWEHGKDSVFLEIIKYHFQGLLNYQKSLSKSIIIKNELELISSPNTKTLKTEIQKKKLNKREIESTGFKLGYTTIQLKTIYETLKIQELLNQNTDENNFIKAFNGDKLKNFIPLEWRTPTEFAVFFDYFYRELKNKKRIPWQKIIHLVKDKANYKQLLSQSITSGGNNKIKETLQKIKF